MFFERHWYRASYTWLTGLCLPLSWLFRSLVAFRYFLYRIKLKNTVHFPVPIIVVGNITVGGTGKTPFVIWLADMLRRKGYRPGIVSRGVGGKKIRAPFWVEANSNPALVGDEALLLVRRAQCPLVVCIDRARAVKELLSKTDCDVVISDDGLQHYRLGRDLEIAIVDASRLFGNKSLLPAGPLREPIKRLKRVDFVVVNGLEQQCNARFHEKITPMHLVGDTLVSLQDSQRMMPLEGFKQQTVHAVVGIGNPKRFLSSLSTKQINLVPHVFPDHYLYGRDDIHFADDSPVIMTEKDAVKCFKFASKQHWYLPVKAKLGEELENKICNRLRMCAPAPVINKKIRTPYETAN
ncbi:MAG: tetraacyldisaccharide 4'-kinase [Gammaproteobacteria bacterium]